MKKRNKKLYLVLVTISVITLACCNYFILLSDDNFVTIQKKQIFFKREQLLLRNYINSSMDIKSHERSIFTKHYFSLQKSDQIGGYRDIPDWRHSNCKYKKYNLPNDHTVSVIISFHNEARSALLRTILSILHRTPREYLQEIVLVDDCSDNESDGRDLLSLPYIKLYRNNRREGLIRSRNKGAEISSGDYFIFLDSHCELNIGWLEPLLARISSDPGVGVSPVIDSIDAKSFRYKASSTYLKGGFDWNLRFKWIPMSVEERESRNDDSDPFTSPTFSGGIFMISRKWFFQLGGFDSELEIWGSESLEFSIKLWLCGGRIEIIPCSRVGHVFRKKHPYTFPLGSFDTYLSNSKRVAESWLDEYRHFFYSSKPMAKNLNISSNNYITTLKKDLQCRPFVWFLQNVFSELKLPNEEYVAFGQIKSHSKCLSYSSDNKETKIVLKECRDKSNTEWALHIKTGKLTTTSGACLNIQGAKLLLEYCRNNENQRWRRKGGQIIHESTGFCLENLIEDTVGFSECRRGASSQLFSFSIEVQQM